MNMHEVARFVAVSVLSAVVGYLAVRFLLRILVNHSLRVFAYYRFALAAVVALVLFTPAPDPDSPERALFTNCR
jgi:undecaprenyl-diphosphatase